MALGIKREAYEKLGESVSAYDLSKQITQAKKVEGAEFLKEVPADTLGLEMLNLDKAYQNILGE